MVKNLAATAISLALALLIGEFAIRVMLADSMLLRPRYHTAVTYGDVTLRMTRPNMTFTHTTIDGSWKFTTNDQGFRNYESFQYEKPDGVIRVVSLGDSHTQGHECHQDLTYSAVIERYLQQRGISAEVMNTGVSGFSTAEALLLLENEMVNYQPDYVVLGFFANDFEDNLKSGLFTLREDGALIQEKYEHVPGVFIQDLIYAIPGVQWLGENSYFYSLLFNTTWELYKSRLASSARESIPTEYAVSTKSKFSDYEVELAAALVGRIQTVANEIGAKFILLDIPRTAGPHQFTPSVSPALLAQTQPPPDEFVSSGVLEYLQGVAEFHVPNGARHINAFTHTLLGTEVGQYIATQERVERQNAEPN